MRFSFAGLPVLLALVLMAPAAHGQERPPASVIVAEVVEQRLVDQIEVVGRIQPRRTSLVASDTEGRVVGRSREAGQVVRRGDPVFQLENDVLSASLIEALADVKFRTFKRTQSAELLRTDAASEQDLQEDEYQLERARAKLQGIEKQIADLSIRAPFGGHIVQTFTEIGAWVGRGENVFQLISIDTVRVYVNVPERYIPRLQPGDEADIFVDALGTAPISGRIVAVIAEGYPESHTFPVVVQAANPGHIMRSNMSARVRFQIQQDETSLVVHKDALVTTPLGQSVYLAIEGKAVSRPVRSGLSYNGYIAVEGDLRAGDLAVVRGNERLQDGQPIRILRKHQ